MLDSIYQRQKSLNVYDFFNLFLLKSYYTIHRIECTKWFIKRNITRPHLYNMEYNTPHPRTDNAGLTRKRSSFCFPPGE